MSVIEMRKFSLVTIRDKIPKNIIQDIKDYHFQDLPWMCWITSIKNISLTMRRYYSECPSPKIKKFNRVVGAKEGIIPDYQTVRHLINRKIYNKVPIKLNEKANSNLKELENLVDRKDTSPVILSVHSDKYLEIMHRKYNVKDLGYDIEGIQEIEGYDHVLIVFKVEEDVIFFDTLTPYLELPGPNTSEKAIFKLPATIIDQLWHEAKVAPRWIMWLERENPYQQHLI